MVVLPFTTPSEDPGASGEAPSEKQRSGIVGPGSIDGKEARLRKVPEGERPWCPADDVDELTSTHTFCTMCLVSLGLGCAAASCMPRCQAVALLLLLRGSATCRDTVARTSMPITGGPPISTYVSESVPVGQS